MLQPLFCYFNPVIGAMCSCWFLNSILFWKGQTTSLDTLSSYRAPRRWDFQIRSKSNHLSKMSHRFAARDPVWKGWFQSERGKHRAGAPMKRLQGCEGQQAHWPWRDHADMGRWTQTFPIARCCAMLVWPSPSQLTGFFCFLLVVLLPVDLGSWKVWYPLVHRRWHLEDVSLIMCL